MVFRTEGGSSSEKTSAFGLQSSPPKLVCIFGRALYGGCGEELFPAAGRAWLPNQDAHMRDVASLKGHIQNMCLIAGYGHD